MTAGVPWNESGLAPELRDAAREAAHRTGMPLEEWLKSAIIDSAAEAGVRPARRVHASAPGSNISSRLDELSARLERLTRAAPAAPAAEAASVRAPSQASSLQLADAVARMNERLDHLIAARAGADFAPRPPARSAPRAAPAPAVVPDTSPLGIERAVAEIAERQRALEEGSALAPEPAPEPAPPSPDLSGLEAQLRHITAQLETLRRPCGVEDAVAELRRDLTEISRTLQEAMPRRALEALQAEVRALGERIDRGRDRAFDQTALAGIEQGLGEVRSALTALRPAESLSGVDADLKELSRKIDLLAETGPDPALLRYLETAIGELRTLAARVASADTVSSLVDDVRALAASVDRVTASERGGGGGLDALATRIESLAQSLDARPGPGPVPAHIEELLGSLADRFERMHVSQGDQPALDHIEEQIVRLAGRIEESNQRLGNLGAIERAIGELMHQVTEARSEAVAAAERVARTVVAEAGEPGGRAEVESLKRDLTELKLDHSASDRRTHDTLEAVHDTLERVVDRLATIESDVRAAGRAKPEPLPIEPAPPLAMTSPQPAAPAPQPAAPAPQPKLPPQAVVRAQAGASKAVPAAAPRRPIAPDLPADTPLEPGSATGRVRPASPAERIAASEAALAPAKPPAAPEPAGKANFIAAARRAAQAAASEAPPASAGAEGPGEEKASGGLMRRLLANRRRTLMIGIAAFVLLVGSWQIANMLAPMPRVEPPAGARSEARSPQPLAETPAGQSGAEPAAIVPPTTNRQSSLPPSGEMTPPAGVIAANGSEALSPAPAVRPPAGDITGSVAPPQKAAALAPQPPAAAPELPASIGGPALRKAALAGDPTAEYEVGIRYTEGRGVPVNLEEAARWFERAANQGLTPALYRLGSIYEKGQGVRKSLEAARRLYLAAAEKGNAKAMHNIAVLHAEGVEGKPDYRAAAQWFRKAAGFGVADSQYNLGILYARGIGVEQNLAESYKWFALAAAQGDQDAGKKREDVAARLDKQALVAARLAVQTWNAEAPPAEAMTVAAPAGGWDKADAQTTKPRPAARPKAKAS